LLKNNGYFYFSPGLLVFKADTIEVDHSVSFRLALKDSIPVNALTPYRINKVLIDQDYSLSTDSTSKQKDTVSYQHNLFLVTKSEKAIRPNVLLESVYLKKGEIYSRENHEITLNRLMSMEHFKFVSVKFVDSDTMASGFLDVRIWMTPMTKRTVKAEIDLVSKSNNFMGPKIDIGYLNRNTFHGAERLSLNLAGSFEAQVGKQNQFSYSLMPQAELSFPEIRIPFTTVRTNSLYTPQTIILLSYKYLKRLNYFDGNNFQLTYGFKWKQKKTTEEELKPFMVSYVSFSNKSTAFNNLLAGNPFLKKNYEEQFIAGSSYDFTYNEEMTAERKMQYFFHLTMETSGNAISLAEAIVGKKKSSSKTSTVFGSVYSQYAKISVESRAYYNFSSKDKLALRLFAGFAKPYGNSSAMPYSKQFFSGGPNSIRAFQVNSIGPGTYHQNTDNKGLFQLGGDVKLETNAEYRFDILRFLKGAFFIDGGNVWLLKPNTALSTKAFSLSGILDEVAVGAGFGLRLDLNFFILRFDLALPLKEPWLEKNHQWVIKQINFADPSWRSDNLVLNVAIGYPF